MLVKRILPVYALGHFAVDFFCAWLLLGRLSGTAHWIDLALVYNFCAFALQMPLGVLADRLGRNRIFAALGAGLVLLAALPVSFWYTAILSGLGNALYHVGGGRETLLTHRSYRGVGLFVAPGAVGIFLGGALRGVSYAGILGGLLLGLCGLWLLIQCKEEIPSPRQTKRPSGKDLGILGVLFAIVLLRSLVGLTMANPWKTGAWVAVGAVLAAAGKAAGGLAADRFSPKWAGAISGLLAAVLFLFPGVPILGVLAGFMFNMSMPITLRESAALLPGGEGFVFGLLTFALFLGFLPAQVGFTLTPWQAAVLGGLSGAGLLLFSGRRSKCTT